MKRGYVVIDGWAGIRRIPVEIIGQTPKRTRVRSLSRDKWPGRNKWREAGEEFLVPKHAVKEGDPPA